MRAMNVLCSVLTSFLSTSLCSVAVPEEGMSTVDIIAHHGYPVQEVTATTQDGFVLVMHRIPYGRKEKVPSSPRPVAFLQHGLLASSADWVLNLPEQSLGFMLADSGFDVWMGNVRGNVYSRQRSNGTGEYWDFSWDEIAAFDLPAMIDKALEVSEQPWLYYVGYSQGTMMMFAHVSEQPEFARKIKKFFALAPVGTVKNVHGFLKIIGTNFLPEIELFIRLSGEKEFLPSNMLSKVISKLVCGVFAFTNPLCSNVLFQIVGPNTKQLNETRLMVYLSHTPAGTSTQNIIHWAQMTQSGATLKYDWMSESKNEQHYGQKSPPSYNFTRAAVPTYLYYSDADWIADTQDVQTLLSVLPQDSIEGRRNLTGFNHIDFVYGMRAAREIYDEIIATMKEYERNVIRP